jgi:3-deoxy-D-arabino-heptulosonate 7-phosphate (DAHP) synthase
MHDVWNVKRSVAENGPRSRAGKIVKVGGVNIGDENAVVIAGPCSV